MAPDTRVPAVVFVVPSLIGGGAERNIVWLANRWAALGAQSCVITISGSVQDAYALDSRVQRIGLELAEERTSLLSALRANAARIRALRQVIRKQNRAARSDGNPLVVVSFIVSANVTAALAMIGLGIPLIVSERNHPPHMSLTRFWRRLRGPAYALADAVVALTPRSAHWLRCNTSARRLEILPNPVVFPLPVTLPEVCPDSIVERSVSIVLAAGKLQYQKGFDLLLDAWAEVRTCWHLVIAGAGDTGALVDQARALGIADRVHVVGRVGNLSDWYARASLFVLSSRYEGFPNVLVEAMASGLAVLSTDCETGPADVIDDGVNGVLVEPDSAELLGAALQYLIDDAALRERLGCQALRIREQYDADHLFARWSALIHEIGNRSGAPLPLIARDSEH